MTPSPLLVFCISHILYILYAWFNPSNQIFMEFVNQSRKNQPQKSCESFPHVPYTTFAREDSVFEDESDRRGCHDPFQRKKCSQSHIKGSKKSCELFKSV